MTFLVLGIALFFGIHAVGSLGLRPAAVGALGEGPWKGLYSLVSFVGLGLIAWGYGIARTSPTVVWLPPMGLRHLVLLLMVPVFPMLLAAYLPGRIQSTLKHPMLAATKLWAVCHLLANGMLADVLLFGTTLAWAVMVRISLGRRQPRPIAMAPAGAEHAR